MATTPIKIYGYKGSPRVTVCQTLAAYEGLDLEIVHTSPFGDKAGMEDEPYKSKFPFGLIPGMQHGDFYLFEVAPIVMYMAGLNDKAGLLGKTPQEKAIIHQWISWASSTYCPAMRLWLAPLLGLKPYIKKEVDAAEANMKRLYAILDKILCERTFIATERVTLADLFLCAMISRACEVALGKDFRSGFPNVFRYHETVVNQPTYIQTMGPNKYIDVAVDPPNLAPKDAKPKKEAVRDAAAVPKKGKAAKPKTDDEEEEPLVPAEPKAKHPTEALGQAKSFPLDEWKRQYSNNDTRVALRWLEEHLGDAGDYSFWRATYKYPGELTQVFMSANLIGGFHNRLEGSRKYLFGSGGVYGTNNNSKIQGVYMIRGQDYKPIFDVAPDIDSYEFTPLDFTKDRKDIEDVWAWEGEMDGLTFAEGKVFK